MNFPTELYRPLSPLSCSPSLSTTLCPTSTIVETDANGRSLCTGVVLFSEESDAAPLASYGTLQLFDQPVELLHGVPGAMFTTTRPGLPVSLPVLQMSTAPAGHPHVLSDFPVPPVGIPSELSVSAGVAEIDLVAHSVGGDKVELLVEAACESLVGSHESEDNAALLEEEMAGGETIVEVLPAEAAEMLEAAKVDEVAETTEAVAKTKLQPLIMNSETSDGAHSTKPVEPAQSADGNEVERKIALKEDEQLQAKAVSKQERKGLHGQKQKRQQKGKKKKNLKGVDLPAATLSQEAEVRKEGETKMQAVKKASRSKDTRPEQETKEKRSKRKQSRTPPRKAQTAGAATTVEATTPSSKQAQDKAVAAKSSKSSPSADQKGSNRRRQNTPKTKARKVEEPAGTGESSRGTPAKAVQSSPASSQVHSAQKARAPRNRKMAGAKSKSPPPLPLEGSGRSRDREGEKVVKAKVKTKAEPKRQQRNSKSEEKPERKKGPAKEFSAEIKAEAQKTSPTKHSRQKGGASRKSSPSNPADKKSMSKDSREQKKRSASSPSSSSPSPAPSSSNRTKVLFCAEETSLRTSKRSAVRARSEADASASVASSMPSSSQPRSQRKRAETAPEVQRNASKIQFKGKTKASGKVKTTIMLESNAAATGRRAGNKQQQQQQQQKGKQAKGFLVF